MVIFSYLLRRGDLLHRRRKSEANISYLFSNKKIEEALLGGVVDATLGVLVPLVTFINDAVSRGLVLEESSNGLVNGRTSLDEDDDKYGLLDGEGKVSHSVCGGRSRGGPPHGRPDLSNFTVVVCKDCNEMIYPLAFGFANSECLKSWTWFLKQLHDMILHPELVMIVSDWHTGISNGMRAIFSNGAHGVCAYHLAKNLKQHCRKRGDVIYHYYRAAYAFKGMPINALCSDFFTTGWLKQAYTMAVNPVPKPEVWDIADDVRTRVVLPWKKTIDMKTKEKSDAFCWGETKATNMWELWAKGIQ
ncbi:hypothetical protein Dsin_021744 [Dipteronia sinensis]|uniref:MULE transposase domain-containing protein n=1 Tax=Dipteronia sinensis TaxID=43782 RepID=A0AAE0A0R8_9ROSI|nr:hypothetical protein Dsin_021744 [Dipteronia sinensis]